MTSREPRPFQGRKQTRRERRASERRSRERAAAWAAAMPPPDPSARVDPLSGAPVDPLAGAPGTDPSPRPGTPEPSTGPARPGSHAPAPRTPAPDTRAPSSSPRPARKRPASKAPRSRRRRTVEVAGPSGLPSLAAVAERASRPGPLTRLRRPWPGRTGRLALYAGAPAAAVGVMVAAGAGMPVLDGSWDPRWLAGGGAAAAAAAFAASRGWSAAGARLRVALPAVCALLVVAFAVGLGSGPVVVDGTVYLSTTTTARSARMADQMRSDLYALVGYDDLLAASQEDARAAIGSYDPAGSDIDALGSRYAAMTEEDLPDPAFAPVVEHIKSAAYWGGKALAVKRELIDQDDAKKSADLDSWRATYASEVLAAGEQLTAVTSQLGIPFTLRKEGPHE